MITLPSTVREVLLLVARVLIGIVLIAHGWQKFATYGIGGVTASFEKMGVPLPAVSAVFSAVVELAGGAALLLEQRPRPCRQLAQLEGLHEVVVGPVVKPGDPVVDAAARRQHQDPRLRRAVRARLGADRTADLPASDCGKVQVEADQVVRVDPSLEERLVARVREVDGIPLAAEARGDRVGQVLLVLDDKHAHP